MSELSKQALKVDNNQSFPNNNNGAITPSILRAFNVNMIDSNVNQTDFDTFSSSVANEFASLTASVDPSITGSSLITASFDNGTRNLTFTKGDATTFNVNIPDVSGSSFNTASFATTGSNTFTGNQQINATLNISGASDVNLIQLGPTNTPTARFRAGSSFRLFTSGGIGIFNSEGGGNIVIDQQGGTGGIYLRNLTGGEVFLSGSQTLIQDVNFIPFSASVDARINAITGSGGSIATGSFATTGSNTFKGDQIISGAQNHLYTSLDSGTQLMFGGTENGQGFDMRVTSSFATQQQTWLIENQGGVWGNAFFGRMYVDSPLNVNQTFTASLQEGYVWVGNSAGKTSTVATSSFGGGGALPSGLLSSSVTNFVDYSASVDSRIDSIVTGTGFATTGSNSFNGDQNITGSARVSGQILFGTASLGASMQALEATGLQVNAGESGSFSMRTLYGGGVGVANIEAYDTFPSFTKGGKVSTKSGGGVDIIGYNGQIAITGSSLVMQGFTYPTTDGTSGQVLTTNGSKVLSFTTISGGGGTAFTNPNLESISGSLILTANTFNSGSATVLHLSASAQNQANLVFKNNNSVGSTIISGSNNIFTNPGNPTAGRVNYIGGRSNLFLNGESANLPQITGSAASVSGNRPVMNGNIINGTQVWTINQAPNTGVHTYSNNILAGNGQFTFNMLGNTGTVSVNNNFGLGSGLILNSPSRSVAQINAGESGSNSLSIQNNSILGFIQYQGPVSSSTHTISSNSIQGGLNLNVQSQSRAINMTGNIINGTMTMNDNTFNAGAIGSNNLIQNNNINGVLTLNQRASSSLQLGNNNINTWTISNDYDASSLTNPFGRALAVNGNALFGAGNNLYASGSSGALSGSKAFVNNLLVGSAMSASSISDGQAASMFATIGAGHGLTIEGTAIRNNSNNTGDGATMGSAFFGRWNKIGQGFNTTGEVILAVGTGTSGSTGITRKTGFLIDSGSNIYTEGTLNVSGSLTVQSGSTFFANGNQQFNVGAFSSLVTQSGSAGVSQSVNFEVTDKSEGVSIASNSRITLANSGTYSITFSAQIKADGGQDTLWMWLKKNGTNVANTSTKLIGKNGEETVLTVNYVVDAVANDYYELAWQNLNGHADLLFEAASGNYPAIPSVILTVTQVR